MPGHENGSRPGSRRGRSGWTRARAALSLGMVLGLGAVGTMAAWSDTVTAQTGLFSTGSVGLLINNASPTSTFVAVDNVTRGQSRSGMITLKNTGSIGLKYVMDVTVKALTTGDTTAGFERGDAAVLGNNLKLDVYEGGSSTGTTCSSTTQLVTQQPMTADDATRSLLAAYRNVAPNNGTDSICVKVTLAAAAPRASRMAQVGVTFTAKAEIQ
ncbi:TasA family protein [Rhodococcus sp. IEGM 1408]|uniref:TasA family protein n=1 Tax=Rhodococcus sp. IEGM 1408 TaxID=3082220 RepID=UPI002954DA6A|nr:TasA family protein [Rhodococcus sp. IEGM 1408]MDV8002471.1 TasA family protein [Rhodococcus sp. IEGM 1408]